MTWKERIEKWAEGLRTYAGTALYVIGQYNAGVVWHVGGFGVPVGEILQAVGAGIGTLGLRGKVNTYQQAAQQGVPKLQAAGRAALQGPILGRIPDAMAKLRGSQTQNQ